MFFVMDVDFNPSGSPLIYVFDKAAGSAAGAIALVCIVLLLNLFIAASVFAVTSRQLFAFARDHGVPASRWLSKVSLLRLIT